MTQQITLAEVKAAALTAHKEGRLLAQVKDGVVPYGYEVLCQDGVARVCAIGACLNRESLDTIEKDELAWTTLSVDREALAYIFECADDDLGKLIVLQGAHDNWLRAKMVDSPQGPAEAYFLSLIGCSDE